MPPTRLTALVSEDGRRTAESPKREGCLSPNGLSRLDDVARIVDATWTRFHASERSRMLGPTVTYDVVAALSGLGYLSEGRRSPSGVRRRERASTAQAVVEILVTW